LKFDFHKGELLLIDKPAGWTSFQAVNKIKYAVKSHPSLIVDGQKVKPKVGHAGTLDPLATGLLIVCTGKRTKTIEEMMALEKEYTGTFFLGATTPCYDLEKPVDKTYPIAHITEESVKEAARNFVGLNQQTPPVFSAIMVQGQRSYDLARAGEIPELKSREITIKEFEISRIQLPEVDFRIVCSKGTYIRAIARDLGIALQSGAYLQSLRRTRIGEFSVASAKSPVELAAEINEDR
jgi:tRNA pseudouridine55 synthase